MYCGYAGFQQNGNKRTGANSYADTHANRHRPATRCSKPNNGWDLAPVRNDLRCSRAQTGQSMKRLGTRILVGIVIAIVMMTVRHYTR
jgi:hypothetical protein